MLCAAINNNNRAYTASIEFQDHMEEVLQEALQARLLQKHSMTLLS